MPPPFPSPFPFPFKSPISIGVDICHIPRITRLLTSDQEGFKARSFVERVFAPGEDRSIAEGKLGIYFGSVNSIGFADFPFTAKSSREVRLKQVSEWFAGRWAAKEATKKAISSMRPRERMLSFHDIRVRTRGDGQAPYITFPTAPSTPIRGAKFEDAEVGDEVPDEKIGIGPGGGDGCGDGKGEGEQGQEEMAQVSISHDGEYAIATVLAMDMASFPGTRR